MNLHIEIQKIRQKYSANPETAECIKDCFGIMEAVTEEITKLSEKIIATRSKVTKEAVKPTTPPLTPLQALISQAPKELSEDLYTVYSDMMDLAGVIMMNTMSNKPESKEGTLGEVLDYLVAPHIQTLQEKHKGIIPTVNHFLYQLANHCLFATSTIVGKYITSL